MSVDLFYFSKNKVTIEQLAEVATSLGCKCGIYRNGVHGSERLPYMRIDYHTTKLGWDCYQWDEQDFDSLDEESKNIVMEFAPASAYQFDIPRDAEGWSKFTDFLSQVFTKFGGWAGSDSDDWQPIYTADNIIGSTYPPF